jgi:DNA-directed RNA polymerase subunit F
MLNYKILEMKELSNSEVLDILEKIEKERELTYREEKYLEYLKKFTKLSKEEFEKAKKEIMELEIPRLEEVHINKILDLMPINGTQIRAIVANSGTVLVDESIKKILEVLDKYRK